MPLMRRQLVAWLSLLLSAALLQAQGIPVNGPPAAADNANSSFLWDTRTAAHLMRRSGFSASPQELQRLVDQGFAATLDELLNPENVDDSFADRFLISGDHLVVPEIGTNLPVPDLRGMQQTWLLRMYFSKRQLWEKMTLFWHDHFATSIDKVLRIDGDGVPVMWVQHLTLREHALGNFKEMIRAIAHDPAMLIWLDNVRNRKQQPNENWARELLELFTMGVDQYTQDDIANAARAFTGWTVGLDGKFRFSSLSHDNGLKTFLGVTGNLDGGDIIDIIFEQPVTAEFIARKLWEFFAYPNPSQQLVRDLGRVFRESGYEIRALMGAILRHPEFYSPKAYRALIKSPLEFTLNFLRELDTGRLPLFFQRTLDEMGQSLFRPPDVGGWTSGVGWLNTSSALIRYNFLNDFFSNFRIEANPKHGFSFVIPLRTIIKQNALGTASDAVRHFTEWMVQGDISPDTRLVLEDYLQRGSGGLPLEFDIHQLHAIDTKLRGLLNLVTLLPVYQLN